MRMRPYKKEWGAKRRANNGGRRKENEMRADKCSQYTDILGLLLVRASRGQAGEDGWVDEMGW